MADRVDGLTQDFEVAPPGTMEALLTATEERDALAAHVERLNELLDYERSLRPEWAKGHTNESVAAQVSLGAMRQMWDAMGASNQTEAMAIIRRALGQDPTTSLARRDARMKADALHNAVCVLESEFDPCHPIIERVESLEAELRRQAEEMSDG